MFIGVATSLWSNSHPCLASAFAWSFPPMFMWAYILCSVMVCVRDISILTIFSRIILSGWLL
jgi:hypothetical protein